MSREIRRVPADWQHPTGANSSPSPLFGGSYREAVDEWGEGAKQWALGKKPDYSNYPKTGWKAKGDDDTETYEEYAGARPLKADYMPDWPEDERTHFQMYETTTPILGPH